ncbi:DUF1445 domain-containing protein [Rhodoplanes sp. TEM]|uniref:DUF1445 domain-containing protein n=1 Tax=Rhodoplanes tepidamans TaxID=200616 RepID=A0ABT5J9D0_RHOTP|nr:MULTISPECIES: DUF1445 domain-containing protein [Rhodoplanes]MDC7786264.1 DUF1445 domain-containing protein [Rhodoplanes tepidamans]MDC7982365.1 DUF1445 domain-containing protein [Rhodoplanes sp. TEM]MDQ0355063.1 uncharacterized protein YcsI (UPF0317 family) [Rhodoplanes tepidamans]
MSRPATVTLTEMAESETGLAVRRATRVGWDGLTVGRAPGHVQANLVVLPERFADDFAAFCTANPAACPLLARGTPGAVALPTLAQDLDLRSDLPAYLVHENGCARRVGDLRSVWRGDLVAFAIGCWFGAEAALRAAGIRLRHVELGIQGPLFRTDRRTVACGPFAGPLVVSMRPFATADVETVAAITAALPRSHGAPIHAGDPAALGIMHPDMPDWGEPLRPEPGETALFWPCGLTALAAVEAARVPFFITHAPGAMLVTDLLEGDIR